MGKTSRVVRLPTNTLMRPPAEDYTRFASLLQDARIVLTMTVKRLAAALEMTETG